jgi:hypothetical protein
MGGSSADSRGFFPDAGCWLRGVVQSLLMLLQYNNSRTSAPKCTRSESISEDDANKCRVIAKPRDEDSNFDKALVQKNVLEFMNQAGKKSFTTIDSCLHKFMGIFHGYREEHKVLEDVCTLGFRLPPPFFTVMKRKKLFRDDPVCCSSPCLFSGKSPVSGTASYCTV